MKIRKSTLLLILFVVTLASGCAPYRTSSNINSEQQPPAANAGRNVLITEDAMIGIRYKTVGPIEVSVRKLTIFHKDPTKEQANEALIEKARAIGANAVIKVTYKAGSGGNWGYIDAAGIGIILAD